MTQKKSVQTVTENSFNLFTIIYLGIIFWITGVLFICFARSSLFEYNKPWLLPLFVAAIPLSWIFVKTIATIGYLADRLTA